MTNDRPSLRIRGLLWAFGLPATTFGALVWTIDRPPIASAERSPSEGRAVIAIRDPVHPVETLGTWMFVLPRLEAGYEEVRSFTQTERGDGVFGWHSTQHREAFVEAVGELTERYARVDVFLIGHTNEYVRWFDDVDRGQLDRLGLVYNSGCHCGRQADRWAELGAAAYVAHPEAASHAPFFVHFLRRWSRGVGLEQAVAEANDRADGVHRLLALPPLSSDSFERWDQSRAQIDGARDLTLGGLAVKRVLGSPFVAPLLALALQVAAGGGLWLAAELAYGGPERRLAFALERPLGLACLALGGVVAGALLSLGLYRLHARSSALVAVPATVVLFLPPLVVACVATWMLAVLA